MKLLLIIILELLYIFIFLGAQILVFQYTGEVTRRALPFLINIFVVSVFLITTFIFKNYSKEAAGADKKLIKLLSTKPWKITFIVIIISFIAGIIFIALTSPQLLTQMFILVILLSAFNIWFFNKTK